MKKIKSILLLYAVIFCFSGCTVDNKNSAPVSEPVSSPVNENSGNTDPTSDPVMSSTPSEPQQTAEEPTFLVGPAGDPIYPSDITCAWIHEWIQDRESLITDYSLLTSSNISRVECSDFVYLKEPTGISYNRYESPEKFKSEYPYLYTGDELVNSNPIKRVYIGEEICGMTVIGNGTSFSRFMGCAIASVPYWNDYTAIKFKGEKTLTGYLSVASMTPDYLVVPGSVTFWPDEQSDPLPVTNIKAGENGAESCYFNGGGFYSEYFEIWLGDIYDDGTSSNICDEALLDGITYGDKDVHVKITIDDYAAALGSSCRATLKSLERL